MNSTFETVTTSAPGKVILFGEHAVVYGVTAIAAALSDLRIFVEISSIDDKVIEVQLHDVIVPLTGKSYERRIELSKMKDLFEEYPATNVLIPVDPCDAIMTNLRNELMEAPVAAAQGMMAIMYLIGKILPKCFRCVAGENELYGGMRFNVVSKGLPIGAGLGSSAAFSVALSAALIRLRQQKQPFSEAENGDLACSATHIEGGEDEKEPVTSKSCSSSYVSIPKSLLPIINGWAYAAEVVIHGSPSGLDNTTSCYGGAVRFRKGEEKFENISNADLPHMRILLTNTKVPRSTKLLVAGVRSLYDAVPKVVQPILESIEGVSSRFLDMIQESKKRKERQGEQDESEIQRESDEIGLLFRINHHLLCALGVGHPSLSAVADASTAVGLSCKLTGAGGGGCAITLLPSGSSSQGGVAVETATVNRLADSVSVGGSVEKSLHSGAHGASEQLEHALKILGFDTFESSLAGDGVRWI